MNQGCPWVDGTWTEPSMGRVQEPVRVVRGGDSPDLSIEVGQDKGRCEPKLLKHNGPSLALRAPLQGAGSGYPGGCWEYLRDNSGVRWRGLSQKCEIPKRSMATRNLFFAPVLPWLNPSVACPFMVVKSIFSTQACTRARRATLEGKHHLGII